MSISINPLPTHVLGWIPKGLWSITDQWLFSGANFLANILLARWLSPEEYGAFALVFSIFLFAAAIHTAVLVEPMLVLGSGRLHNNLRTYLKFLLAGHLVISLAGSILLALAAAGFSLLAQPILYLPTASVSFFLALLLLPWLLRRSFYIEARADLAAASSAIYMIAFIGSILLMQSQALLSSSSAFAAMGIGGLISCLPYMRYSWKAKDNAKKSISFKQIFDEQWAYAKWSGPSAILIWVPLYVFYLIIPYSGGLVGAAMFKALSNLINPVVQSNQALFMLLIPRLSGIYLREGRSLVIRYSGALSGLFLAFSAIYLVLLLAFGPEILQFLYGNQYQDLTGLLIFAGLLPAIMGLSTILGSGLRAMEQPKKIFIGYAFGAAVAATAGVLFTIQGSVSGALIGQGISYLAIVLVFVYLLKRPP